MAVSENTFEVVVRVRRVPGEVVIGLAVGVALLAASLTVHSWPSLIGPREGVNAHGALKFVLSWKIWLGVSALMLLEHLLPAHPHQRLLRRGTAGNFVCALFRFGVWTSLLALLFDTMNHFLAHHAMFLSLGLGRLLPTWVILPLGFVIADFVGYWRHRALHRVPFLWRLHAMHHSDTDMNSFSDDRTHPLEWLFASGLQFLVLFVLDARLGWISFLLVYLSSWHSRLYHSNVDTDLGPLTWLIVTPNSHRIHHSTEPRDFDRNFGTSLVIWDRLFSTRTDPRPKHPTTGLEGVGGEPGPGQNPFAYYFEMLVEPFRRRPPAPTPR